MEWQVFDKIFDDEVRFVVDRESPKSNCGWEARYPVGEDSWGEHHVFIAQNPNIKKEIKLTQVPIIGLIWAYVAGGDIISKTHYVDGENYEQRMKNAYKEALAFVEKMNKQEENFEKQRQEEYENTKEILKNIKNKVGDQ